MAAAKFLWALAPLAVLLSASGFTVPKMLATSGKQHSRLQWRRDLDVLLSPEASFAEREILVKDIFARLPEIGEQVAEAARNGRFVDDIVLPEGTESRKLADDLQTVRRQLTEDILPELPNAAAKAAERLRADLPRALRRASSEIPQRASKTVTEFANDPKKLQAALESAREEANNLWLKTPDLYTPAYKVVAQGEGYEVRDYESYAVASTPMTSESMDDPAASGEGFNTLAGYLFGSNSREESMAMTTPVTIAYSPDSGRSMAFVLPQGMTAAEAPLPRPANAERTESGAATPVATEFIAVSDVQKERLAVTEFTGFATEKEVQRQLSKLREALRRDARGPDESGAYRLFQFNPPWTVPWRRRNEIAIRLRQD